MVLIWERILYALKNTGSPMVTRLQCGTQITTLREYIHHQIFSICDIMFHKHANKMLKSESRPFRTRVSGYIAIIYLWGLYNAKYVPSHKKQFTLAYPMNTNSHTPFDNLMQISQLLSDSIRLWFNWHIAANTVHYLTYVLMTLFWICFYHIKYL